MAGFSIPKLLSGGLITNYNCTSRCRHCLYNCSPSRAKEYVSPEVACDLFRAARKNGAQAMHIGGGEPMLEPEKLGKVLMSADRAGVHIEYVETNSSWFKDHTQACQLLGRLKAKGLSTLLISISPFHIEYIPFKKVLGVIQACREAGIGTFLWMDSFMREILAFDPEKPHRFDSVLSKMGPGYLTSIRQRYWIHEGGRAIQTFRPLHPLKTMDQVLDESGRDCRAALCDASHFHLDLYGNYVPGLCAGLAVNYRDLEVPLDGKVYPLITILAGSGIRGLVEYAGRSHGFADTQQMYSGKCDLCNDVRRYLVETECQYHELAPIGYYTT